MPDLTTYDKYVTYANVVVLITPLDVPRRVGGGERLSVTESSRCLFGDIEL